jgi:hypothetical protein
LEDLVEAIRLDPGPAANEREPGPSQLHVLQN